MHACASGHTEVCSALLAAGADSAPRDSAGLSALTHAVVAGEAACVSTLLSAGAAADEHTATGAPLLLHALAAGQDAITELLLEAGASPNAATDLPPDAPVGANAPPLLLAAQSGSVKLVSGIRVLFLFVCGWLVVGPQTRPSEPTLRRCCSQRNPDLSSW
jgi:ankyrin repeat protein